MTPPRTLSLEEDPPWVAGRAQANAFSLRRLLAFAGPGYLVAVGYMDPGNWATDLAAGSGYGYRLLSIVVVSNVMAVVLQSLSARLGIVTGMDLAQHCRARYGKATRTALWLLCEGAIIACELAEVIGTAVALKLLFGIPLIVGVCLTALNVVFISLFERKGTRRLEAFVLSLMLTVTLCLAIEVWLARPDWAALGAGLLPSAAIVRDPAMLYIATGIVGATVMPHNLYLHSAAVRDRARGSGEAHKREAIRYCSIDSALALTLAMLVNGAILIIAAATFHASGRTGVSDIGEAYKLLSPMLGAGLASTLFGIALLASGQNSTITGALAGQVVMEGFTNIRLAPWARRLITRGLAIVPAAAVAATSDDAGTGRLLVLSQVVLSLQLPIAVIPLVRITSDRAMLGRLVSPRWLTIVAWLVSGLIIALNIRLIGAML